MPDPPKPTLPPFWKWLMRVTFAVTMALFLAPAVYVVKYYAVDKPAEEAYVKRITAGVTYPSPTMYAVIYWERQATDVQGKDRIRAVHALGVILHLPAVGITRPLECLSAKATLADLATKDKDAEVRAAASVEIGKVAQRGAVIRR